MPRFGGAPKCPRCAKSVYHAEEVKAAGGSWHKGCFNCRGCNFGLSSANACDGEGEIWCKACHGKNFGPKGYGFGGGAGVLQMTGKVTPPSKLGRSAPSFAKPAPAPESKSGNYCTKCKRCVSGKFCSDCGTKAGQKPAPKPSGCPKCGAAFKAGTKFCTECGEKLAVVKIPVSQFGKLSVSESKKKKKPKFGGADRCKRCNKPVYSAEKKLGAGSVWHEACFRCRLCGTRLSSNNMADQQGEIYCNTCHAKQFGPKGFGYGQGAGTLAYTE